MKTFRELSERRKRTYKFNYLGEWWKIVASKTDEGTIDIFLDTGETREWWIIQWNSVDCGLGDDISKSEKCIKKFIEKRM